MQKHSDETEIQVFGCGTMRNLATNSGNILKIAMACGISVIVTAIWKSTQIESVSKYVDVGC
jgi:hypothetical protein